MPTCNVNGVRLNYVQMDEGDGCAREDLVLVHGLATNMAFWYFQYAPEFAKRFRVTLFDLRGHGRSEMSASGYTPANMARDMAGLLDHLGIEKAHFLAHSFGGVATLNFACQHPERVLSLVLADSHISAVRHVETLQEWHYGQRIQPILDRHGLDLNTADPYFGYKLLTRLAQFQMRGLVVPAELADAVNPFIGNTGQRTAAQWLRLMDTTSAAAELMGDDGLSIERLRELQFPILAMYGDHSQARLTGAELLSVWEHAEFLRVRDAGHFFPISRADEVIQGCYRLWGGEFASRPRRQRAGEPQRSYFRSDRVFMADGAWYYTTRERTRVGPFAASEEAAAGLESFISAVQT